MQKEKTSWGLKRATYMLLSVIIGMLSASLAIGLLETAYINSSLKNEIALEPHHFAGMELLLSPAVYALVFAAGLAAGIRLGFWGWRVVYIEHRHRKFTNKK
jgi:hypothetical protein